MDLKLYALTFKIKKYITRTFLKMLLPIQFDNKFIMPKLHMAKILLFPYKMMNCDNQI
jgi:hypothetical protein